MTDHTEGWMPGVLSKEQMRIIKDYFIDGIVDFDKSVDYSSLDLFLSDEGYKMLRGSIKPSGNNTYNQILSNPLNAEKLNKDEDGAYKLDPENCYVFKLNERLNPNLPKNIYGQATAKSSIGRLDVIARLIVDGMSHYEYFDPNMLDQGTGAMYLEIIPISFKIRVKAGASLTQLRLFYGKPDECIIKDKHFIKSVLRNSSDGDGYLTVDIRNTKQSGLDVVAFCARSETENYIDLWEDSEENKPDPRDYWKFVAVDNRNMLELTNGSFYLLRSTERMSLPSGVALYAKAMDETLGEMRIHYAGFVHPHFGRGRDDHQDGTPLIFEVRAHNVNVTLAHGERLAKLIFYRMSKDAEKELSGDIGIQAEKENYNDQELELSKHFQKWPDSVEINKNGEFKK